MKIAVAGTGYVGLVTGACLADFGTKVTCVDKVPEKIEALKRGEIPIYEPGLDLLVAKNMRADRLSFSTDLDQAVRESEVIFIAVGTPPLPDGSADLTFVREVARTIGKNMKGYTVIVNKSTVPIGTGKLVRDIVLAENPEAEFSVVSNPEFLREGSAIKDFMEPDRVVLGIDNDRAESIMKEVYKPLYHLEIPFLITNVESAELIKYASNGFLATKISFINEIAVLCELMGGDVLDVARGMGLDERIGPRFLQPGPGFGGSCFPKDSSALVDISRKAGYSFQIMESVIEVNRAIKDRMVDKVRKALGGEFQGKTVGLLGLAFKPETDDIRDTPALPILEGLQREGATVRAFDPAAMENMKEVFPDITYCTNAYETATGVDCLVLVTEWNQFRFLQFERLIPLMRQPLIVDLRNIYEADMMRRIGVTYHCVGRPTCR
ncbi:MAG TPA: UDP-glucose/GDP-mannose dehydrogenase family protein [Thermoanaerobaculia bacterium]|nr:UDP-glucose/GDP-mannose dehydrogenase family protein [Thermoanaerobaculia bacterium]HUM30555.1 UDP-glucose/GDP-mannose dehydrogenase family protein [Thermoanaerobaculia bacterium]HXK68747.1 UDP-glucose/GDP-mannose dehydrogenase family protein [Thermoanaerobaculia bacterium]